jgi:hypothetical protein
MRHLRICVESSPEGCLAVAEAGLARLYDTFSYHGTSLQHALALPLHNSITDDISQPPPMYTSDAKEKSARRPFFETATIYGTGTGTQKQTQTQMLSGDADDGFSLPMGNNKVLRGKKEVMAQMEEWVQRGVVEPDTAAAISNLHPEDLNLNNNNNQWVFVVMGAGAAMGPLETLLSLGAHVIAVDLPIPAVWNRLIQTAKASPGTLSFPIQPVSDKRNPIKNNNNDEEEEEELVLRAGCNLLTQIVELRDWLISLEPTKRLVLGSYAYLDSKDFVKVSLAMDAVASGCLEVRPNSALAYLCSPTDCFAVPPAARHASLKNYHDTANLENSTLSKVVQRFLSPNKQILKPNYEEQNENKMPLVDALVLQQGPNYFLAKRLQHWRAMISKYKYGAVVSSNVAPASNTTSVLKNKLLAAAYAGAHHVSPLTIFDPATSNTLMTYLLLHDLKEQSSSSKKKDHVETHHPLNLFATTPVHNGIWRCGYQLRSLLELVVLYHYLDKYQRKLLFSMAVAAGLGAAAIQSRL